MKRTRIIILCIMVVLTVCVSVFIYVKTSRYPVEKILPQGPLFYLRLSNIQKNLAKITSTDLWQTLQDIDYELLIKEGLFRENQVKFIQAFKQFLSDDAQKEMLKRFFGQEVAIALYPSDFDFAEVLEDLSNMPQGELIENLFSDIVVVTRVSGDIQFAEFLLGLVDQQQEKFSIESVDYKNHKIHSLKISDVPLSLSFVRIKDLLILGIGESAARKSLDVLNGMEDNLEKDDQFQETQKHFLDSPGLIVYGNIEEFFVTFKKQMDAFLRKGQMALDIEETWGEMFSSFEGLKTFGISTQWKEIPQMRFNLFFDPEEMNEEIAELYLSCGAVENNTLRFIPQDILGYLWGNCLNLEYYWEQIMKEMAETQQSSEEPPSTAVFKDFEEKIGFSIEDDILPSLGEEFGGYLAGIQKGALFPIPELVFFIEIDDQNTAERLMSAVMGQFFLIPQTEKYYDIPIHYLALPMGENLQPSYCFLDNYLLIGINRQLIKNSIDAFRDSSLSLGEAQEFKDVNFGLTDANTGIQFVKVDKTVRAIKDLIEWADQWMLSKDIKKIAFKSGSERRLEDIKKEIQDSEEQIKAIEQDISRLREEIEKGGIQELELSQKQAGLKDLEERLSSKQMEIQTAKEKQTELEAVVKGYDDYLMGGELGTLYLEKLVYPILGGFESFEAFGARTIMEEGVFETMIFLKIKD